MNYKNIGSISNRLNENLPGWDAQKQMSPIETALYREATPKSKQAAVMILLFPDKDGQLHTYYIKRTNNHPQDKHGGQISFPGGQKETIDRNFKETALRETYEEIGVNPLEINILGKLSSIFVFASNFKVYPFVGYTPKRPELNLQVSEVDYVIDIPIQKLSDPAIIKRKDFTFKSFKAPQMPYYDLNGEILWGATAMMTAEFLQVLNSI